MTITSTSALLAIVLFAAVWPLAIVQRAGSQQKAVIVGVTQTWSWNGPIIQDLRSKDRQNDKTFHFLDAFVLDNRVCAMAMGSLVVQRVQMAPNGKTEVKLRVK